MKNRKLKEGAAILAAVVLTASSFAGCGKGDSGSDQTNTGENTSGTSTQNQTGQNGTEQNSDGADEAGTELSYPISGAPELSIWSAVVKPEQSYTDYTQSPFHMGLAENTGVTMKWEFPAEGTDARQAYNLMLTDETLPDIIYWTIASDGDAQRLIDEGVIRDLSDLLPQYAPNFWNYLQEHEHYGKTLKTDEGSYYGFGSFRETPWSATFTGPVIRKDWLDALGLEIPKTIEDWDTVLKAFKENYGAAFGFATVRMNPGIASGFGAFGTFGASFYVDDAGKIQLAQTQSEWKDYMTKLNEWYQAGYIDPDVITIDDAGMRTKALNNEVGISVTSTSQVTNWILDAKTEGSGAEWIGIPYPSPDGQPVNFIQAEDMVSPYVAVVTTSCTDDEIEAALRWLDYGYTEEGFLYWNYGTEGETYTVENGLPTYTSLLTDDPKGISSAIDKYCGTQWTGLSVQAINMVKQKCVPESVAAMDTWVANTDYEKHLYPLGASLTTAESNEFSTVFSGIQTYAGEMILKFLIGEEPLGKYDDFVKQMESMGLDRVLEIKQAAFDRFQNR